MKARTARDVALEGLAEAYGTPLYVFDLAELERSVRTLREGLPEGASLCYAVKANSFVLGALDPLVERFEACSPGEYRICHSLGLPGERVVVSGVHKEREVVEDAVAAGALVSVESVAQLELLEDVASRLGTARALVRLSSGNQFGLDLPALRDAVRGVVGRGRSGRVRLEGLQYFSGTQKSSARRLRREVEALGRVIEGLREECGWEVPELEYGPGLPVSYFDRDELDEAGLLRELSEALGELPLPGGLVIEAGRRVAASCGAYLTRVVDAKETRGERYAIVDGGINHLVYYGQSMAMRTPPCRMLGAGGRPGDKAPWNVCGSLCTVNDVLVKQLPLASPSVGDVIAFERAGAYCMAEGISLFLSRDLPAVVLLDGDGEASLARGHLSTDALNAPSHPRR